MQNHKRLIARSLALCLAVSSAHYACAQGSPAAEMQSTSERISVLELRLKELELDNKIQQLSGEQAARGAAAKRGNRPDSEYGTPVVELVEGRKGALEAVLVYRGGVRQRVREGDVVFGAAVKKIGINEVVLVEISSKAQQRLQFNTSPVTRDANGQPAVALGGPLPMGMAPGVPTMVPSALSTPR